MGPPADMVGVNQAVEVSEGRARANPEGTAKERGEWDAGFRLVVAL